MRTRAEQIVAIRADQRFWRELADEAGVDRWSEPGPMGEWTFGDLAGHLLGWRERTIQRLQAFARGEPDPAPPWPASLEAAVDDGASINDWIHARHADRTPAELVDAYHDSYDRLIAVLGTMPDAVMSDPDAIPWVGVALVDVDFTGHLHDEHVPSIRAWLRGSTDANPPGAAPA